MTDILQSNLTSPIIPSVPNFPMPSATPTKASKNSSIIFIAIGIVALALLSVGGYIFFNQQSATIANINSTSSTATLEIFNTTLKAIPTITAPTIWSAPTDSSIKDASDTDIYGQIIGTPPMKEDDASMAKLLSSGSPLVTTYGWTKSTSESSPNQKLTVFQKDNMRIFIKYQYGAYFALVAEL